jgi:hypothetical protein
LIVRVEPSLNLAVTLAAAEGLVQRPNGEHIELTPRGIELADAIDATEGMYVVEKELMASIGKQVSEKLIKRIFETGS